MRALIKFEGILSECVSVLSAAVIEAGYFSETSVYCDQTTGQNCRSQWPRGLRRRSTAARLLRSWVRIPPGAWMFVCCECCVLLGRGLCDGLITYLEESY